LQFSPTAERVIKENKIPESQLKDIIGHGPRGLVMKSDVLEVFLNEPKDKQYLELSEEGSHDLMLNKNQS
jgi:hypothetical protein